MSVKEQIVEQLESLPDAMLTQIFELIQIFKQTSQKNNHLSRTHSRTIEEDPLVGLFDGSRDLATNSEEILAKEIRPNSGFTWKSEQ